MSQPFAESILPSRLWVVITAHALKHFHCPDYIAWSRAGSLARFCSHLRLNPATLERNPVSVKILQSGTINFNRYANKDAHCQILMLSKLQECPLQNRRRWKYNQGIIPARINILFHALGPLRQRYQAGIISKYLHNENQLLIFAKNELTKVLIKCTLTSYFVLFTIPVVMYSWIPRPS